MSLLKIHCNYLHKFGTERIKAYSQYLLNNFEFNYVQRQFVEELPEYYNTDKGRFLVFTKILTIKNLWYTIYLW